MLLIGLSKKLVVRQRSSRLEPTFIRLHFSAQMLVLLECLEGEKTSRLNEKSSNASLWTSQCAAIETFDKDALRLGIRRQASLNLQTEKIQ